MTQRTKGQQKVLGREEAFTIATSLVQEAVDVANSAGIKPSSIVAPHCSDITMKDDNGDGGDSKTLNWCGIPVIIDNHIDGLFEMPELNDELEQQPAFLVTQATADLVRPDFERYKPSLERMAEDWQEEKTQFMREQANKKRGEKKPVKRSEIKRQK